MRIALVAIAALVATMAVSQHGNPPSDNKSLEVFLGEWTGTATQAEFGEARATAKGVKYLGGRFVRTELDFDTPEGKIEAVAMMSTEEDGSVGGYFFASMASDPIIATGRWVGKKLIFSGRPLRGDEALTLTFDFSVADKMSFTLDETDSEGVTMTAELKRKKDAGG